MNRRLSLLMVMLSFFFGVSAFAQLADRAEPEILVPANYSSRVAWPVIFLLHGYTSDSQDVDRYMQLSARRSSRGFILVIPNGRPDPIGLQYWNATDACCDFNHLGGDDVGYIMGLLAHVRSKYNVDSHRIYAIGHSNGAFMAHRLACDEARVFAGIVSFAGETYQNFAKCRAEEPVSLLQIQAADDDVVGDSGGVFGFPGMDPYPGAAATVAQWAYRDGCTQHRIGPLLDLTTSIPGPDTQPTIWSGCRRGTEVQLWTIARHSELGYSSHRPDLNSTYADQVLGFLLRQRKN